jgi:hypothetical protein
MSTNGATMPGESNQLELPLFSLDVQAMDLGPGIKAVGLELVETENREPVRGPQSAAIWSAVVPALTADDAYVVDFFSHVDRVAAFCDLHEIKYREGAGRCLVLPEPHADQLRELFERFEKETFGCRAGLVCRTPDVALEGELARRGLDAYQEAYRRYTFCAVCEPEDGWFTMLSEALWSSEVIRRVRPALQPFDVYIARPQ